MPETTIHYLWVGPPTKQDPSAFSGHDVAGPIKMAKKLDEQAQKGEPTNLIKFWCLAEHKAFYEAEFSSSRHQVQILVCTIESLLESQAQNSAIANFINDLNQRLKSLKESTVHDRVMFKDNFSFLILAMEGGYFLDTNVFPMSEKNVLLQGESRVTAVKSPDGVFDYYFMYSPQPMDANVLKPIEQFKGYSFDGHEYFEEPYLICDAKGVCKTSYKSYVLNRRSVGLFSFLDDSPEELAENLQYGDINLQITNSLHIFPLVNFSLFDLPYGEVISSEEMLKLPFSSNEGYVLNWTDGIYYINKEKQYAGFCDSNVSYFNTYFSKNDLSSILVRWPERALNFLVDFPKQHNKQFPASPFYIEHMANISGCTLLHHAVLLNKPEHIEILLQNGARLDLKAQYRHVTGVSSEEKVELTPEGLAKRLDRKEVIALFAKWRELQPKGSLSGTSSTVFYNTKTDESFGRSPGCLVM